MQVAGAAIAVERLSAATFVAVHFSSLLSASFDLQLCVTTGSSNFNRLALVVTHGDAAAITPPCDSFPYRALIGECVTMRHRVTTSLSNTSPRHGLDCPASSLNSS